MRCVLCNNTRLIRLHTRYWQCSRCGLTQTIPMRTPGEIKALYHEDIEHFEPYVEQIEVHRAYFRKQLTEFPGVRNLLDIGCAMGVLLEEAGRRGIDAYGVDVSADAVAACRKKGLKASLTYPKKTFDAVTAFEVIEHEPDPLAFMRRVYKLLNKRGIAVLTTPDHSGFWSRIMGSHWVSFRHPEHVTFWDPQSLTSLFRLAGFRNITVKRDFLRPFPLSFLFTRAADYFPQGAFFLKPVGRFLDRTGIMNPVNPWDDLIVYGRK